MKKTRILFVEDDLDYRYLIERELEKEKDFELCAACSDGENRRSSRAAPPAGYRSDGISMGNSALNGAEAAREIRLQTDSLRHHPNLARKL